MVRADKISTQDEYDNALEDEIDLNKNFIKLDKLNELDYDDLILLINTKSSAGKVAFGLVRSATRSQFPKGNCKIAWEAHK